MSRLVSSTSVRLPNFFNTRILPVKSFNHFLNTRDIRPFSNSIPKKMEVFVVPVLDDNYSYILADKSTKQVAVVDPVEPAKVIDALNKNFPDFSLTTLLTTHHHWDHSGGNEELIKMRPGLKVFGADDRIPMLNEKVTHNQTFKFGDIDMKCYHTPGHTTGHICFYAEKPGSDHPPVIFTGDTLFVGGCGRFFEGTPEDMYNSLIQTLSKLPKETQVYCGHEYTQANLKFAVAMEPENDTLKERFAWAKSSSCTVPSTIQHELTTNPFMRVEVPTFQEKHSFPGNPIEFMGFLRNEKNNFK